MVVSQNHYQTLGVAVNSTSEDISKAYKKLLLKAHPDKGGDAGTFQKIREAHEILRDPTKRRNYDLSLRRTTHSVVRTQTRPAPQPAPQQPAPNSYPFAGFPFHSFPSAFPNGTFPNGTYTAGFDFSAYMQAAAAAAQRAQTAQAAEAAQAARAAAAAAHQQQQQWQQQRQQQQHTSGIPPGGVPGAPHMHARPPAPNPPAAAQQNGRAQPDTGAPPSHAARNASTTSRPAPPSKRQPSAPSRKQPAPKRRKKTSPFVSSDESSSSSDGEVVEEKPRAERAAPAPAPRPSANDGGRYSFRQRRAPVNYVEESEEEEEEESSDEEGEDEEEEEVVEVTKGGK